MAQRILQNQKLFAKIGKTGSRSTLGARQGIRSNGRFRSALPCGNGERLLHKIFQILDEAALKNQLIANAAYPSGTGITGSSNEEGAVIENSAAGQPNFLQPSGETTVSGLAPTAEFGGGSRIDSAQ
jgi:hypothetical protein